MTDAKWRSCKQMQNAQTRSIAKALIDLNQFHVAQQQDAAAMQQSGVTSA